jgi:hypothetical protein
MPNAFSANEANAFVPIDLKNLRYAEADIASAGNVRSPRIFLGGSHRSEKMVSASQGQDQDRHA